MPYIRLLTAVALLGVVASSAYWYLIASPQTAIGNLVGRHLTDPESAQFRDVRKNAETGVWCGTVNSKNKMGGYVGHRIFMVLADQSVTMDPKSNPVASSAAELFKQTMQIIEFGSALRTNCPELYAVW